MFVVFYFFMFFVFWGATSKIAVLPAWELNSGEPDRQLTLVTSRRRALKKQVFASLAFSSFFHYFWCLLGGLGVSFGILLEPLSSLLGCWCHPFGCLWLAWAVCGLSLLLFVVPVARLGCLWALGPPRDLFFALFLDHLGVIF